MAPVTNTATLPLVAIAVREHGMSDRLVRELRPRIAGAELSTIVGERALRDALAGKPGRAIDILVVDDETARMVAGFTSPGTMPLVGVIVEPESAEDADLAGLCPGFTVLKRGPEPHPFSEAALWISGAVAAAARGRAENNENVRYGRRYEDLVHALPDIVYELDIDGVITFVNESVSLLGYAPADLVGKHYSVLLHDDDAAVVDRDRVLPEFAGYRTGLALSPKLFNERRGIDRRTTDLEVRLKKKPGSSGAPREVIGSVISYGEVSSAGEYARDDQKEFKGSVGIIRDVTLRRKSEEMLRKLYQAVDQLGSCVFVLNHAFEVEYVNPAFFMLTGFAPPDIIGCSVFRFFAFMPDKVERLCRRVQDGFESREEVLVPRAAGGQFWAEFTMAPVRTPSGAITHAIAIVDDTSSRKAMEELLRNARRDAEESSRSKSLFLSSMTQEMKGPVGGIVAAARLLQADCPGLEAKTTPLFQNAQALLDVLTGILDHVRSENMDGSLRRSTFPLDSFMERTCSRFRKAAEAKGLGFSLSADSGEMIESDSDRLSRVVELLVDNAVRHTDHGSVDVEARMERLEGNVPHLIVRVVDTGNDDGDGSSSPFDATEPRRDDGSRFGASGLALARNIVMVLGGEIRKDSTSGKGNTFSIVVPTASPVKASIPAAVRYTVLVVDDNVVNLEYMRTLIENCGHRVHCAAGATEALRVLETRYVDAALFDIQMPGCSGTELARTVRAYAGQRYSPSMPLFAMTAQDRDTIEDADRLFAAVFPKPTDIRKFSAALCSAMEERETVAITTAPGAGIPVALARARLEMDTALSALSLAVSGTSDARVDIRAEASILASVFRRFSCRNGQELVGLFIEHYAEEDKSVLSGLLERIGRMLQATIAAVEASAR